MQDGTKTNQPELINYSFLQDRKTSKLFAKLDYRLRSGEHFQFKHPDQSAYWEYLAKHEEDLSQWYDDVYQIVLASSGTDYDRYFYLDFDRSQSESISSNISFKHRQELSFEHVLVGFLLWRVLYIDCEVELTSKNSFFKIVSLDSDQSRKTATYKIFALSKSEDHTDFDDEKVFKLIDSAFSEFNRLGWIVMSGDNDTFEVMGSFQRLIGLYRTEIEKIYNRFENSIEGNKDDDIP